MTGSMDIPRDISLKLCDEIRAEYRQGRFSIWKLQCFFCYRFAGGDRKKLCLSIEKGCPQVNKRYKWQTENK